MTEVTNYDMMCVIVDRDTGVVSFCELTDEGRADDSTESFAEDGVWTDWADYMSPDRALEQIKAFIEDDE
jgi:hypothetical protein